MSAPLTIEVRRIRNAFLAEVFKVVRRRMTYILLLSLAGLVLTFYILLWLGIRDGPGRRRNAFQDWLALKAAMSFFNVTPYGLALERLFATVVCVVFAGTMVGNEFDWRTVGPVTGRGVRRWHFLLSKTVVAILFTVVAVIVGFLVAAAASAWFSHLCSLPYGTFGPGRFGDAVAGALRTVFVIVPFVLLAILCATVWRSAGQAVGATLGVYFMESVFTGLLNNSEGWVSHLPQGFLNVNGDSVMTLNGRVPGGLGLFFSGSGGEPAWRAVLVLCTWAAAFMALAFWRFQRRDIQE
jgi:ABC-type transport system involved in multi-copper enzyme maturation permease subunit